MRKNILLLIISVFTLFSCDFLNTPPLAKSSTETFYNDPENCQLAVNAMYDPLQWQATYDRSMWAIGDVCSDDAEKGGGDSKTLYYADQTDMHQLARYQTSVLNPYVSLLWSAFYVGITRANTMLDATEDLASGENKAEFLRLRGEARFLRAFYYFDLVRVFGPVPLIKKGINPVEAKEQGNRAAGDDSEGSKQVAEIYKFIVSELESIKEDLPWSYSDAEKGRVTQAAARALLAKAYLYQKNYESAFKAAEELINHANNPHHLEANYADIFDMDMKNENSIEYVFKISFMDAQNGEQYGTFQGGEGSEKPSYTNVRYIKDKSNKQVGLDTKGYGFNIPRQDLIDQFDSEDPRLDMIWKKGKNDTIYWNNNGVEGWYKIDFPTDYSTGYYCKKSTVNFDKFAEFKAQSTGKDIPLIRWAEVLLIAAEAGVQSGHNAEALAYVNDVRERARNSKIGGSGTIPADLSSVTIDDVKKERRMELFCEGHRYFDVVRWDEADEVFGNIKEDCAGYSVTWNPATKGRFPIPSTQIKLHSGGKLMQNPGY